MLYPSNGDVSILTYVSRPEPSYSLAKHGAVLCLIVQYSNVCNLIFEQSCADKHWTPHLPLPQANWHLSQPRRIEWSNTRTSVLSFLLWHASIAYAARLPVRAPALRTNRCHRCSPGDLAKRDLVRSTRTMVVNFTKIHRASSRR